MCLGIYTGKSTKTHSKEKKERSVSYVYRLGFYLSVYPVNINDPDV